MYVYAISNNCNYDITVSNGYAKKEDAFLGMIEEMNTALATEKWRKSRKPDRDKSPHGFFHVGLLSFLRETHKKFT